MLNKLIVLYSFIITLSPSNAADEKYVPTRQDTTTSSGIFNNEKDAWQPYIPTHKWLPQPLTLKQNSNSIIKEDDRAKTYDSFTHNLHYTSNTDHLNQAHQQQYMQLSSGSGNYVKPLILQQHSMPIATQTIYSETGKHTKLKPSLLKTMDNSDNQKQYNSQQHWQFYNPLNNIETLYPQIISQVPNNSQWQAQVLSQKNEQNLIKSQLNLHQVTDIENVQHHHHHHPQHHHHQLSPKPLPYWQQYLKQSHSQALNDNNLLLIGSSSTKSNKIENKIVKRNMNLKNSTSNPLKNKIKDFNEILNNEEITSIPYTQHNGSKTENQAKNVSLTEQVHAMNSNIKSILSDNRTFNTIFTDTVMWSSTENFKKRENESNSNPKTNKGQIDNENHLNLIKFPSQQLVIKTRSTSATADSAAEEFHLLNIENKRQLANVPQESQVAQILTTNNTQHRVGLWNVMTSLPSQSSEMSTSRSLSTEVISGRKIKKVKKKFRRFLLPLLLAYKLKFIALLPLLVGGLVLLVGTTGLAGFFFALFTAVMSLKSNSRNAIVVKKY